MHWRDAIRNDKASTQQNPEVLRLDLACPVILQLARGTSHSTDELFRRFHYGQAFAAQKEVLLEGRCITGGQRSHDVRFGDLLGVGRTMIEGWNHDPCVTGGAPDFKL